MGYIGPAPTTSFQSFVKQDITTSATANYTLSQSVTNANELRVVLNNVIQEPTTAYTASGTSLTMASALTSSDDLYVVYMGKAVGTVNPASGSVGMGELSATGTKNSTTFLRGDNSFAEAGKILQVVQTVKTDTASITSSSTNTFVDLTGLSVAITPSSTSNKILVTVSACVTQSTGTLHMNLVRNSTNLLVGDSEGSRVSSTISSRFDSSPYTYNNNATATFTFLDSPNTTSATTYKLQGTLGSTYSGTMYVNRSPGDINADYGPRTASTITVMEVSA